MNKNEKIAMFEKIVRKNLISAGCYAGDDDIMNTYFPPSIKRLRKLAVISSFLASGNNAESLRRFIEWYTSIETFYGAYKCAPLLERYREEYAARTPLIFTVNTGNCPRIAYLIKCIYDFGTKRLSPRDAAYRVSVPFSGARWYRQGGKVDTF